MGQKAGGVGHFSIPTGPAVGTTVTSAAANNFTASPASFGNAPAAIFVTGLAANLASTSKPTYVQIKILVAGSTVGIYSGVVPYTAGATGTQVGVQIQIDPPIAIANGAAITVASADSVGSLGWTVTLVVINQSNVVDNAVNESANVIQWNSTNVSSPATAGIPDINVKNVNNVAAATPGASGGILISGSNSGTTTLAALTVTGATTLTGNVALAAGLTVTQSTTNGDAISATGNGTGAGMHLVGGANGDGLLAQGTGTGRGGYFRGLGTAQGLLCQGGTDASGIYALATGLAHGFLCDGGTGGAGFATRGLGAGAGWQVTGGATGAGIAIQAGATSGIGVSIATTSGDGVSILPTVGHAIVATANGTSKHGIIATGGTAGTSDGVKAVAGTGGVPIRGDLTGNITGSLSGSAGSVTGAVGSVTGAVGSVAGNVVGSVASVTARVTADSDRIAGSSTAATNLAAVYAAFETGTAQAGAASAITLRSGASAVTDFYKDQVVFLLSGTGAGQTNRISAYNGGTKVATVITAWATQPDVTSVYLVVGRVG